ncbi:MAG TPA: GNAT family N-acetyltransferase [Planctomycetota bacterium]|nr:GNAT family N-acetyltransferase [Planctomycetota bacterium]
MIEVRPASSADIDEIKRVSASGLKTLRCVYRPNHAALQRRQALGENAVTLVALIQNQIVGVVRYREESPRLHVFGLAVDERFRRRSVARVLLEEIASRAVAGSFQCVSLFTIRQTGNVSIFERLGFEVVREQDDDTSISESGAVLTEVYMERALL